MLYYTDLNCEYDTPNRMFCGLRRRKGGAACMQPGAGTAWPREDRGRRTGASEYPLPNLDFMYFETADGVKVTVFNHKRNHVNKCSTQYVFVGTVYI